MVGVSIADEFRILENVQACANDPELWLQTLDQIQKTCSCRIYLLELDGEARHTGRYCDGEAAAQLITYLSTISVREGHSAFEFLLKDALAFYPYKKELLDRSNNHSYYQTAQKTHEFAIFPGYICTLRRSAERTVLFCCLFVTEDDAIANTNSMLPTYRRLSKAISLSLELSNRLDQATRQQSALRLMLEHHSRSAFLIDTDFGIQISTPACEKLLADGDVFTARNDRLVPMRKDVESALVVVRDQMTSRPRGHKAGVTAQPEDSLSEQSLVLARADNRLARVLVRGLHQGYRAHRADTYVLVEVRDQLTLPENINSLLKSCFDLSEKEAQLAYHVTTSGSLTDTLDHLGITRNTAKTHLRRIYEKTATQSQLELSKLLHGLAGLL